MIKDNRPYTNENGWIDDELITDLPQDEMDKVLNWIKEKILPRKTVYSCITSYGLKHILDRDIGIYLTNNQFKDAMMMCGYKPKDANELNWHYFISGKSPAFARTVW
jgi:hypothetical protein